MASKEKRGGNLKSIIVAVFLVALVLFYFNHLSNNSANRRTEAQKTEIEKLSEYDMVYDYPNTPRDLAKLHSRYMKLFYGQKLSDQELERLHESVRNLYCQELLAMNPQKNSLDKLKSDIKEMRDAGYSYQLCELPEASQITTYTHDGKEFANVEVRITMNTSDGKGYLYQEYIMVKENDQWKIYGWGESKRQGQAE